MSKKEEGREGSGYICIDLEFRKDSFNEYIDGTLSEQQRREFEDHILLCHKCREDIDYLMWVGQKAQQYQEQLKEKMSTTHPLSSLQHYLAPPLPVTSILDWNQVNLTADYYREPMRERLVADTGLSGELSFPFTITYAEGKIVGQFWRRASQIFFRLEKSTIAEVSYTCVLVYTSSESEKKVFEFREGEEKRIGAFREIVKSETIQGMLEAMQKFQLIVKQAD